MKKSIGLTMGKNDEKANRMAQSSFMEPIPTRENKFLFQSEIDRSLALAATKEIKRQGTSRRKVIEWALRAYLLQANPTLAVKLGIHPGEKPK